MDTKDNTCPHCGSTQPKEGLICAVCGGELTPLMENTTSFLQPHAPAYSRHRRLFVGLVLGGLGLAGVGSCLGPALLRGTLNTLSTLAPLPIDKHRVLNFPFEDSTVSDFTWLQDNRHLLGFDYQTFFFLDVKSGKKDWIQPSALPSSPEMKLLWSSDRRYVAEVGNVASHPYDNFRAVVWDLLNKQRIWNSPSLGHLDYTFYPCALAPGGASFALCQDINDPVNSDSSKNTTVQIWDIQHNRLLTTWNVQDTPSVQEQTDNFAVTAMAWSSDNTRLALICAGGSVQVWDVTAGSRLWTYHIANGLGATPQWSPDGSTLAVNLFPSGIPAPIEILDAHTGKLLFQTTEQPLSSVAEVSWRERVIPAESSFLLWYSDGTRLALLTSENGRDDVQVCDAHTGQHLFTCQHVDGMLTGCSWSPNGRYLAAGVIAGGSAQDNTLGEGSTIQFWDAQSGKALFAYQAPRAPSRLIWSVDSHFLAADNPQDFSYGYSGFSNFALQIFQVE